MMTSSNLSNGNGNSSISFEASVRPRDGGCMYCGLNAPKHRKGKSDPLLKCRDCRTIVHLSCMDYGDDLIRKIANGPWQCTNCKTCTVCHEANEDDCMLFCDSCDLGYHMSCHRPSIYEKPVGKWECSGCSSGDGVVVVASVNSRANASVKNNADEENVTSRFLPILPPHYHPHTGMLPENWEDYEEDPEIPDVALWDSAKIRDYFIAKGFNESTSNVFLEQEIDGRSLLLLHRNDVVSSLGLKLGPALKVFSHVKKLQTRRNFPDY